MRTWIFSTPTITLLITHHNEVCAMGFNDHIDQEMHDAVQDLVDEGLLKEGSTAHGIALQVADKGFDSLKGDQIPTWNRYVGEPLAKRQKQLKIQRVIDSNPE
ncbi:hypothetical protein [Pseudomonas syringae]|nr:hypothetical protein [Pseudomonas syringae]